MVKLSNPGYNTNIPHSISFILDSDNLNWAKSKFHIPNKTKQKWKLLMAGYDRYDTDMPHRVRCLPLSLTTMTMNLT